MNHQERKEGKKGKKERQKGRQDEKTPQGKRNKQLKREESEEERKKERKKFSSYRPRTPRKNLHTHTHTEQAGSLYHRATETSSIHLGAGPYSAECDGAPSHTHTHTPPVINPPESFLSSPQSRPIRLRTRNPSYQSAGFSASFRDESQEPVRLDQSITEPPDSAATAQRSPEADGILNITPERTWKSSRYSESDYTAA